MEIKKNQTAVAKQKRGGFRPNSGRPRGRLKTRTQEIVANAAALGVTPLEYMLDVLRNSPDPDKRMDAAKAAAPFVHPRLAAIDHSGTLNISHEDALSKIERDIQPKGVDDHTTH